MREEPTGQRSRLNTALRSIFDDMFEGVQIIDREWRYVYLNQTAATHGRRAREDLLHRSMTEAYPGIDETDMFRRIQRCMTERVPQRMINHFTYPDGRTAWFDLRMSPVPQGVLVLSVDVSEQKAAEEALRRSREDLETTLDCIAEGVVATDVAGHVTGMNPAAEALTGWSSDEARGRLLGSLVQFQDHGTGAVVEHPVERVLREGPGTDFSSDAVLVARGGQRIPIAGSAAPIRDGTGSTRGVVMVLKDVREEYELAAMLRHSQKMEAVGRLAGGMAHDFNNVLSVIAGYADLLLEYVPGEDRVRAGLTEILNAAERGASLTGTLLSFSRKRVYEPQLLDVNDIVGSMETLLRRLLGEDIELIMKLAPGLHAVRFDAGQIEQIILNLSVNARDAMPAGGTLVIETGNADLDEHYVRTHPGARAGPHMMIAVTDTGEGMDETTKDRIFEPFFTTKPTGKGTGLGLSTLYGNVKQGGGNIWVYSEPGRGTTFKVYLPRAEEEPAKKSATFPTEAPTYTGHETILVVEDEPAVRELIRTVLGGSGYTVLPAGSAEEALHLSEEHDAPIHLLLTDVVLPGVGGPDLAQRLWQTRRDLRVAYMSGYADEAMMHHGILDPRTAFIEKPLTARTLLEKVREFLE